MEQISLSGFASLLRFFKREGNKLLLDISGGELASDKICPYCRFRTTAALYEFVESAREVFSVKEFVIIFPHLYLQNARIVELEVSAITNNLDDWRNLDSQGNDPCSILPVIKDIGPVWQFV